MWKFILIVVLAFCGGFVGYFRNRKWRKLNRFAALIFDIHERTNEWPTPEELDDLKKKAGYK